MSSAAARNFRGRRATMCAYCSPMTTDPRPQPRGGGTGRGRGSPYRPSPRHLGSGRHHRQIPVQGADHRHRAPRPPGRRVAAAAPWRPGHAPPCCPLPGEPAPANWRKCCAQPGSPPPQVYWVSPSALALASSTVMSPSCWPTLLAPSFAAASWPALGSQACRGGPWTWRPHTEMATNSAQPPT